jgi:hypothetical protein
VRSVPGTSQGYPESFAYDERTASLKVGIGEFAPVSLEVWDFEVSGLKVVRSWLGYRMSAGQGRRSSALDDIRPGRWTPEFTSELLRVLWILEATLDLAPIQAELLDSIMQGPLIDVEELPRPTQADQRAQGERASLIDIEEQEE